MFDKPQATHTLGIDLDGPSLKAIALSLVRGQPKVDTFFELPIAPASSPNEYVKPLYIDEQKEQLLSLAHKNLVVTSLNAQEVLVRPLELKIKKIKDIDAILSFQAEPLLPYPIENALVDKIIISKDKEGTKLSILAVRKDHLTLHLQQWNSLDIEPETITATPAGLALFSKHFTTTEGPIYALHIGRANSLCILVDKGILLAAQAIPRGIDSIIEALMRDQKIDFDEAYQNLSKIQFQDSQIKELPSFLEAVETLRLDVTRTIFALAKQAKGRDVPEILLTGEGACLNNLTNHLCRPLNKILLAPQELPGFATMTSKDLQKYALPIGAALSALPKSREQINFRQQEFSYPAPWKRLKQPVALYLLLCFGVAIALVLFGKAYLSYQETELKRQYLELINIMNKPYPEFEKEYAGKMHPGREFSEPIAIESLTQDEIKSRLNFLEKELQSTPQSYPLQPNMPLVSDVLAWISTHPNVVGKIPPGEKSPPALQIENFTYTMLKRPELAKKQEKYQVKVELEFTSPTPKMAREFHDALIAPNDIVDPKGEIKWNSNRDKYRTSFYLKDKTIYPNT